MKYIITLLAILFIQCESYGQAPHFVLTSAVTTSNTITKGTYASVTVTLKNTGSTNGPFDFECDLDNSNGSFTNVVIGKKCGNGSGYTVNVNSSITLTFDASSNNADLVNVNAGSYLINVIASNIKSGCPACGSKTAACIGAVGANGFVLPYPVTVVVPQTCTNWSISPSSKSVSASGGSYSASVSASGSCSYGANFPDNWIVLDSYNGATINYHVTANNGSARTGHINVNDNTDNINGVASLTINQDAVVSCNLSAPTALSASNLQSNSFSANWQQLSGSNTYTVEVATSNSFSNLVTQGNYTSSPGNITGFNPQTTYYYRIKYTDGTCTSGYSNTISVTTTAQSNNQPPVASFNINGSSMINAGDVVHFTGIATNPPISSWQWSLPGGNPSTSNVQSPSVIYNTPGTYRVILTACNSNGCSQPFTQVGYINVKQSASTQIIPTAKSAIGKTYNQPVAEPIQIGTGSYSYRHNDFHIPAIGDAVLFTRFYNSLNSATDGSLGSGWSHSYNFYLDVQKDISSQQDTLWHLLYPDGHEAMFVPVYGGNGSSFPLYSGTTDSLVKNNGGDFSLFTADNHTYHFSQSGYLTGIVDLNGNTITLAYSGNNLTGVTGQGGRSIALTYNAGNKITTIRDPLNRSVVFTYDPAGNLVNAQDPNGKNTSFVYDANHLIIAVVNPLGDTLLKNTYDGQQRVVRQQDEYGNQTSISYNTPAIRDATVTYSDNSKEVMHHDSLYRRVFVRDALGYVKNYAYDNNSNQSGFTNENLQSQSVVYDAKGNALTRSEPGNQNTIITYNKYNFPLQVTDPNNNITSYSYDPSGNLLSVHLPDNTNRSFIYNANGKRTGSTDGRGNTTSFTYSSTGDILNVSNVFGTKQFEYDGAGRITKITDENNHATAITYDNNDNIKTITDPLQHTVSFSYDANNQLLTTQDKNGFTTAFTYDKKGRLLTKTNAKGGVTTYTYDSRDNPVTITDPIGHSVNLTYDAKNRKTSLTSSQGTSHFLYDGVGNLTRITDATGRDQTFMYSAVNRLQQITDNLSNSSAFSYDNNNNVTGFTDPLHLATSYSYDGLNRLHSVGDPTGKTAIISFDENGNKKQVKDASNHAQALSYDAADRISSYQDASGNNFVYGYDPAGNTTFITKPTGTITHTYDSANRVTTISHSTGNNYSFTYDSNGNITTMTNQSGTTRMVYDSLNDLTQYTDPYNKTVLFTYDKAGNKTSVTYPGNFTVRYGYDNDNHLSTVTDWLNHTFNYNYDPSGKLIQLSYPNGVTCNYTYDNAGRLNGRTTKTRTGTVIASSVFVLDANGNRTSEQRQGPIPSFLFPVSRAYSYADDDRLLSDSVWNYSNDNAGNRFTSTKGSLSSGYTFSVDNLLTGFTDTLGKAVNYSYDALGNRLSRTSAAATKRFVQDISSGLAEVLQVTDGNGVLQSQYVYGLGLLELIDSINAPVYYHFDAQHNTIALTNDTAGIRDTYTYDPFGILLSHTGATKQAFTFLGEFGVEQEDSATYYVRARYYDAGNGRFLSRDPFPMPISSTQHINRFVYVTNNPLVGFDYNGMFRSQDDDNYWENVASTISEGADVTSDIVSRLAKYPVSISVYKQTAVGYERIYYDSGEKFLTKSGSPLAKFGGVVTSALATAKDGIDIYNGDKRSSKYFDLSVNSIVTAAGVAEAGVILGIIATAPAWVGPVLIGGAIYGAVDFASEVLGGKSLAERLFGK